MVKIVGKNRRSDVDHYHGRKPSWMQRIAYPLERVLIGGRKALRFSHESGSQFGELLAAERTPIIELNSSYGVTALRDQVTETNGGTVGSNGAEIQLSTGTSANSIARIRSAEVGRYIPGFGAEIGIGIRTTDTPTGTQVFRWGGLGSNQQNGVYFGQDSTGIFVARLRSGSETKVYQSNWNIDKLDGTGDSGFNLDTDEGKIYQIDFTWYGYGQILFGVIAVIDERQLFVPCHQLLGFSETSLESPNLQVFADAENNDETTDASLFLGGRQYAIVGRYNPRLRFTGDIRGSTSVDNTIVPLVSFRRKSDFSDRSVKFATVSVLNSGNNAAFLQIRLDGSLTGESFSTPTDYTASETALESDTAATAITGGEILYAGKIVASGQGGRVGLSDLNVDIDIPDGSTVSLCAATFGGLGGTTMFSGMTMTEEW